MKKRIVSFFLTTALVFGNVIPVNLNVVHASEVRSEVVKEAEKIFSVSDTDVISGTYGEDIQWTLDEEGLLTVSGTGMFAGGWGDEYKERVKSVIIEDGITVLEESAFDSCYNLTDVVLPESLTHIGYGVFLDCYNLTDIVLPDGLLYLGENAFMGCESLREIVIPEGITAINNYSFHGCIALEEVDLPPALKEINMCAFCGCRSLKRIFIPASVTYIDSEAFIDVPLIHNLSNAAGSPWGALEEHAYPAYSCVDCGNSEHVHSYDVDFEWDGEESCTAIFICCLCGDRIEEACEVTVEKREPTCTESGEVVCEAFCDFNGETYSNGWGMEILPMGHSYEPEFEWSKDYTLCVATFGCASCDSVIDKKATIKTTRTEPGCETSGKAEHYASCVVAGEVYSDTKEEILAPLGHNFSTGWTIDKEATNKEEGSKSRHCTGCDARTDIIVIPKLISEIVDTGKTGDLTWILTDDGKLTLSGKGVMGDYSSYDQVPWYTYRSQVTSVVIEEGVSTLGSYAFYDMTNMKTVEIADTVTDFGEKYTFYNCTSLTEIAIPENVTDMGDWGTFEQCTRLGKINIPSGVTRIGSQLFALCWNLPEITIPDTVTTIDSSAFAECSGLREVILPKNLTYLGTGAFLSCSALKSINIPSGITTINKQVFYGCISLENITIPETVNNIADNSFYRVPLIHNLSSADGAPWGAKQMHCYDEDHCQTCGIENNLDNLNWEFTDNGVLTITGKGEMKVFGSKTEMPWYEVSDKITAVELGDGITSIGDYAFYGLENLKTIRIPETVEVIGAYAFKNAVSIDGVKLPQGLKKLGESAFYGCESLTSIDIPAGIYTVQPYTFKNCKALADVTFHEGNLMKIADGAFYGTAVRTIILPDCLDILDSYVFKNCTNLKKVILSDSMTEIREASFYGTGITTLAVPEGVTVIKPYAFKKCTKLTSLSLPTTLTEIGEAAFYECSGIKNIVFPHGLEKVGNYAFRKCTGLISVHLPNSLTHLGESAFHTCTGLTELTIPESVEFIGPYCLSGSTGIKKITFLGDAPAIGEGAFKGLQAVAYYPKENVGWTSDVMIGYGGEIEWMER